MKKQKPGFDTDGRRKHHHWVVTVVYPDGEKFQRVYKDAEKAERFALRQEKSPAVERTEVSLVS